MFSVAWTPINTNSLVAGDQNPCWLDIVGDSSFPAMFIAFDDSNVYFRLRVNCDPLNENRDLIKNQLWGMLIKDTSNDPQFTVRVNTKNNDEALEVFSATDTDPFDTEQCSNPITGNVEVDPADSSFGSDPDFFVEFRAPLSCFPDGFFESNHIYCGFTSADDNNINKETPPPYGNGNPPQNNPNLCGGIITPPSVNIRKEVTPNTGQTCSAEAQTYTISIIVTNTSGQALNITVNDVITSEFIPTSPIPVPPPFIATLAAGATQSFTYQVTGFFLNPGSFSFNTATVTNTNTGAVLGVVEGPIITVTRCRGLIFS